MRLVSVLIMPLTSVLHIVLPGVPARRQTQLGTRVLSIFAGLPEGSGADLRLLLLAHEGSDA